MLHVKVTAKRDTATKTLHFRAKASNAFDITVALCRRLQAFGYTTTFIVRKAACHHDD